MNYKNRLGGFEKSVDIVEYYCNFKFPSAIKSSHRRVEHAGKFMKKDLTNKPEKVNFACTEIVFSIQRSDKSI